jgi:hypothetical protein
MGSDRGDPVLSANLTGFGGFSLNASALPHIALASTCIPYTFFGEGRDARCNPGDRVAVAAEWDTRIVFPGTPPQPATLHGVTYQVTGCGPEFCPGQLAVSGTFATADFIAPSFLVGDVFTLHEPFTFVGSIVYTRSNGTLVTEPLTGKGIVTVELTKTDEGFQGTETIHETKWLRPSTPMISSHQTHHTVALGSGDRGSRPRKGKHKPLPEELARDAIAHEEPAPGDKVRMTLSSHSEPSTGRGPCGAGAPRGEEPGDPCDRHSRSGAAGEQAIIR